MKKVFIIGLGFLLISNLCSKKILHNIFISNANASCITNECIQDCTNKNSSLIGLTKDQKITIAKELFIQNLNDNKIDYTNKEKPVESFINYNINSVDLIESYVDKFIVRISYDVQCTDESDRYVAGNGMMKEQNWVISKSNFVEVKKSNNEYIISNIF